MIYISDLSNYEGKSITLKGWVYNIRTSKKLVFIEFRDGTGLTQCIVAWDSVSEAVWNKAHELRQESSVELTGTVYADERSVGGYEIHISDLKIIQIAEDYPITPKEHGIEFLMENRHLWLRSRKQWAAMRVRNQIIFSIHSYFQKNGFVQLDAPIFTGNAAEGTTTLFETDYFDDKAYLTQSGQLYAEAMAMAHSKVYTFGPTFRAEKSKTRRHLTEFWMIEPEMAFYDLNMNMDLAEDFIRSIINDVLTNCSDELAVLERDLEPLQHAVNKPFERLSYDEAFELLKGEKTQNMLNNMIEQRNQETEELRKEAEELKKEHGQAKKRRKAQIDSRLQEIHERQTQIQEDLKNIPHWKELAQSKEWGEDFGGSDETLITLHFETPILIHRYPAEIKAFYMKRDPERDELALAVDMLAPEGYGEIIGGSEREDDLETLKKRLKEHNLDEDTFKWYLDLRRYGTVPHSGFGMGLERTVAWLCGLNHVRETVPFPRMMGRLTP